MPVLKRLVVPVVLAGTFELSDMAFYHEASNNESESAVYGQTAESFMRFDEQRLSTLQVMAPYEPKGRIVQWVRGNIRYKPTANGFTRDLVVTGPRMRVCYGGCRYNRISFALLGAADAAGYAFERWIRNVGDAVKSIIWANPGKYKPGSVSNTRFVFDDGFIRPSNEPGVYPDELVTRLSVRRFTDTEGAEGEYTEIVDTDITMDTADGQVAVDPKDVANGSTMIPIIKISFNRNQERFGLVLTVLKAKYFPNENAQGRMENASWTFDEMSN